MLLWRSLAFVCGLALLGGTCLLSATSGCGASATQNPGIEGNTNWLQHCDADSQCGGDQRCLCDTCTAPCSADDDCTRAGAPSLACLTATAHSCAAARSGLCSTACTEDPECGSGHSCVEGVCLASPEVPNLDGALPDPDGAAPDASGDRDDRQSNTAATFMPPARCRQASTSSCPSEPYGLYTYQGGECVAREGCVADFDLPNANFPTIEDCRAVCEGRPSARECPEGTEPRSICTQCGPSGGCATPISPVCAKLCTDNEECRYLQPGLCFEGVCMAGGCF